MPVQLSQHFTLAELTKSATALRLGIDNTPNAQEIECMRFWCNTIGEPIRAHFGRPMQINSFFRSPELNKAEGGARNSQHTFGQAGDIEIPGVHNADLYRWIRDNSDLYFDQMIAEHLSVADPAAGWVHISAIRDGGRREAISCVVAGKYVPGLQYVV